MSIWFEFIFCLCMLHAYGAFVYEILLRQPPIADNIGTRYCMLKLRIRQGSSCPFHRERRGKWYEWNFDQSFRIDENDFLTFGVHFLTDAPATAHEGSRGSWAYGLRRALRAVLQESPAVGFRVAVQASAADACPRSSDSVDWPVATGDPFFSSAMRGDDGDPRGLVDDYCHADRWSSTDWASGEDQLAAEGYHPHRRLPRC